MFQISIGSQTTVDEMSPRFLDEKTQKDFELIQNTATIREGQRVPTPDREAILQLTDRTEEKHHLRKQQQLLSDIALKAREQDITQLSGALSRKCTLDEFDRKYQRPHLADNQALRKYATNNSGPAQKPNNREIAPRALVDIGEEDSLLEEGKDKDGTFKAFDLLQSIQTRPQYTRAATFFPKRNPRKKTQQTNSNNWKNLPQLQISFSKGLPTSNSLATHTHIVKTNLIRSRKINGPIQLKHYMQPKDPLAPLILPSIQKESESDIDLDRVDSFFKSNRLKMTKRPKTIYDGFMVSKPPVISKSVKLTHSGSSEKDAAWVTQSMATLSLAPSTSPTPGSTTARAKTVISRVSYS